MNRRELVAKTAVDKGQVEAKINCGAEEFEIQLLKADRSWEPIKDFCDWLIHEKGKKVRNIHIHLLGDGRSMECIESILEDEDNLIYTDLTFKTADYCGGIQGFRVGVIIHKATPAIRNEREVMFFDKMLYKYDNVLLYVENHMYISLRKEGYFIAEPARMFFDYVRELKETLGKYNDRIWALVDTAHLISDIRILKGLKRLGIQIEIVTVNEVFRKYRKLIKGVHLSYSLGSGVNVTSNTMNKHGIHFEGDSGAELALMNLVHCIENYLGMEACVVLEVVEDDYLNPKNYDSLRNKYYEIYEVPTILENMKEKRRFSRLDIDVDAKVGNFEVKLKDISVNEENRVSFYTLRMQCGKFVELKLNVKYRLEIEGNVIDFYVIKTNVDGYVIKTSDVNTPIYVDRYYGFDSLMFEPITL